MGLHAVWVREAEKKELLRKVEKEEGKEFKSTDWKLGKRVLLWKHFNLDVPKVETLVSLFRKPPGLLDFSSAFACLLQHFTYCLVIHFSIYILLKPSLLHLHNVCWDWTGLPNGYLVPI